MAGGDSLVAHPRGCRPRSGMHAGIPGRRCTPSYGVGASKRRPEVPGPEGHARTRCTGRGPDAAQWSSDHPPAGELHTRHARLLPVRGRRRQGPVRGEGEEPSCPLVELLRRPGDAAPAHGADGRGSRPRRVDPGLQRRRSSDARVLVDKAAPATVQHQAGRRQELSVAGDHPRRRVAASCGRARQAQAG